MPIISIKDRDALAKGDDVSAKRELYIDSHECANLHVEYQDELAWVIFNKMPEHTLPYLPMGYQWARANEKYSVIREEAAKDHKLLLILYGPDKDKVRHVNFVFQVDGVSTYSFAHTKNAKGPARKTLPMSSADYTVLGFKYSDHRFNSHVRGHLVDHQDTITEGPEKFWSTSDRRNFVPEPPEYEWGLGIRRLKVAELRASREEGAYAQFSVYPKKPWRTSDGTAVPEYVYFYPFKLGKAYEYELEEGVYNVEWEEAMKRPASTKVLKHAADALVTSALASPAVKTYKPDDSDQGFRLAVGSSTTLVQKLLSGDVVSRFPDKDGLYAHGAVASSEFEAAGGKFAAGLFSAGHKKPEHAAFYIEESLRYAGGLDELDDGAPPFNAAAIKAGNNFFKLVSGADKPDALIKGADVDDLKDLFRKLTHS